MNSAVLMPFEHSEPDFGVFDHRRVYRMLLPGEVRVRTTLSATHIHRLQGEGRFPVYGRWGGYTCGLPEHVLDAFIVQRMIARVGLAPLGCRPPLPLWRFDISQVPAQCGIYLLRRAAVLEQAAVGKRALYEMVAQGLFASQLSLGERTVCWVAHEVSAWVFSRGFSMSALVPRVAANAPPQSQ